jgi:hypothetical protein
LTEWIAYASIEPFGTGIDDQRMGMICSSIMNAMLMVHSDPKKKPKWYVPSDFIPDYLGEEEIVEDKKQTVDDMKQVLKAIAGVK